MKRRKSTKGFIMSNTRATGLEYLKKKFGLQLGLIRVSKLFHENESWTKSPAWWIEIPLKKLKDSPSREIHLLCQNDSDSFYYLCVPISFLNENLSKLAVIKNEKISLFLSASQKDRFVDLRGPGKIDFGKWLKQS